MFSLEVLPQLALHWGPVGPQRFDTRPTQSGASPSLTIGRSALSVPAVPPTQARQRTQARARTLKARLSADELAEVQRRAALAQRTVSDYVRLAATGRLPERQRIIGGE